MNIDSRGWLSPAKIIRNFYRKGFYFFPQGKASERLKTGEALTFVEAYEYFYNLKGHSNAELWREATKEAGNKPAEHYLNFKRRQPAFDNLDVLDLLYNEGLRLYKIELQEDSKRGLQPRKTGEAITLEEARRLCEEEELYKMQELKSCVMKIKDCVEYIYNSELCFFTDFGGALSIIGTLSASSLLKVFKGTEEEEIEYFDFLDAVEENYGFLLIDKETLKLLVECGVVTAIEDVNITAETNK